MSKKYTPDELNNCSKEMLVTLFLSMQDQFDQLNKNMDLMLEQLKVANQHRFGRSTEKLETIIEGQLNLFNEAEGMTSTTFTPEVTIEDVCTCQTVTKSKKHKGQRNEDLSGLEVECINHSLSAEKLIEIDRKSVV